MQEYNWSDKVVLIVEDHYFSYMFYEELLCETGIKIIRAENASKAIDIVKKQKIDLVLMDIQLPDMTGYIATQEIKKIKNIPVIAQTAFVLAEERRKSILAGCDEFLTKPVNSLQLMKLLQKYFKP